MHGKGKGKMKGHNTHQDQATRSHVNPSNHFPSHSLDNAHPSQSANYSDRNNVAQQSKSSSGARKQTKPAMNANYLLNFQNPSYQEEVLMRPRTAAPPVPKQRRPQPRRFNKDSFIQANCRFQVQSGATSYQMHLSMPDEMVDWAHIEQIIVPSTEELKCPICLDDPVAGRIARCGHLFCMPCVVRYLSGSSADLTVPAKCPICPESIRLSELKSVVLHHVMPIKTGTPVTFSLMKKSKHGITPVRYANELPSPIVPLRSNPDDVFQKITLANDNVCEWYERERRELDQFFARMLSEGDEESAQYVLQSQQLLHHQLKLWHVARGRPPPPSPPSSPQLPPQPQPLPENNSKTKSNGGRSKSQGLNSQAFPPLSAPSSSKPVTKQTQTQPSAPAPIVPSPAPVPRVTSPATPVIHVPSQGASSPSSTSQPAIPVPEPLSSLASPASGPSTSPAPGFSSPPVAAVASLSNPHLPDVSSDPGWGGGSEAAFSLLHLAHHAPTFESSSSDTHHVDDDVVLFFQSSDGQYAFLHPFNFRCLKHEFPNPAHLPHTLTGNVVDYETTLVTADVRLRHRCLSHLPTTTAASFCEIDMRDMLSKQTRNAFAEEFKARAEKRRRRKQQEIRDRKKQEADERACSVSEVLFGISAANYDLSFVYESEGPLDLSSMPPLVSTSPAPQSSNPTATSSTPAAASNSSPLNTASSAQQQQERAVSFRDIAKSGGEASRPAVETPPPHVKQKQKNKKGQLVLFSTGNRGGM
eukprot:c11448_g1_i2.p1 GENE.c11448_g1_i2~~c11448_g1_i2.p1  ORF type:complete len:858 (+),score=165.71 c11448_g1_i2:310-2574(+)